MVGPGELAVVFSDESAKVQAEVLAARLGTACVPEDAGEFRLFLSVGSDGLSLCGEGMVFHPDFRKEAPRVRRGNVGRELLVRAAKVKTGKDARPFVVDATAGLGEDSLLLAAAGFDVRLYERDRAIFALLEDALSRAAVDPFLADIVLHMSACEGDALSALAALGRKPDVVYLDPMFPERTKSASVKKKFQLLHLLESPCDDEGDLLQAALAANPRKVVIKRPLKGPYLAGRKPDYSLKGKAIRYDCIVRAQ